MGEYNPKSKGLSSPWWGMQRRLPETLGTFQIVILAGFLSLLILRSTIGLASLNFTHQYSAADDEYAREEQSQLLDEAGAEPKRTLVQTQDSDALVKLRKKQESAEVEFEDGEEERIAEQQLAQGRAAAGKDVKKAKDSKPAEVVEKKPIPKPVEEVVEKKPIPKPVEEVLEKKPISKPVEEVVENFQQVEDQLGEEETADELADFERFEKGEKEVKVSSTKQKEVESKKSKKENSVDKSTEKEKSAERMAEKDEQNVSSKEEKPLHDKKSDDVGERVGESESVPKVEGLESQETPQMTPEQLEQFQKEAMSNMSRLTRRDHPDAFTLGPKISNWDQQRASWLEENPNMKSTDPHEPKVLLLSGSQPWACNSSVGDHYLLKMIKNKVDYARIHKMEIFYSFAHLEKPMTHFWAKLPLIRKMMLMRPEVEWIFWMDSDALFTDMVFDVPFEKYKDQNLVMWGNPDGVYEQRSWVACNTGVMFLRNTQWTLDLLEEWSHFGPEGEIRSEAGKIMTSYLTGRPKMIADDQSSLVYLLSTMPELRAKVALEDDYLLSGYWVPLVSKYEEFAEKSKPGAGGQKWPFTTHFTGCQPCSGENDHMYEGNSCLDGMERAFNFADNQVLRPFGFEHENLYGAKVLRIRNETTKPIRSVPVHNPWAVEPFYT